MPQLLLQGFPDGAIRIGSALSVLKKEGRVTYFVGPDNFFSHDETDMAGQRFAIATLIGNGQVRASEVERSDLGIAHRTLMHWTRQMGVGESTLRKAVRNGRVARTTSTGMCVSSSGEEGTTKSERGRLDARAAEGMGTACTRADDRMGAALGLIENAATRFERCVDVDMGGVLAGLPALCGNGLLSGLGRHLSLTKGFYSALHILTLLGFMALARIRRPEGLRHVPPGEPGKTVGLDRVPEVRTLREKIGLMASQGSPQEWLNLNP